MKRKKDLKLILRFFIFEGDFKLSVYFKSPPQ